MGEERGRRKCCCRIEGSRRETGAGKLAVIPKAFSCLTRKELSHEAPQHNSQCGAETGR